MPSSKSSVVDLTGDDEDFEMRYCTSTKAAIEGQRLRRLVAHSWFSPSSQPDQALGHALVQSAGVLRGEGEEPEAREEEARTTKEEAR